VRRHSLGILKRSAGLEVGGDPCGSEGVAVWQPIFSWKLASAARRRIIRHTSDEMTEELVREIAEQFVLDLIAGKLFR
jgi:hypothetical protein